MIDYVAGLGVACAVMVVAWVIGVARRDASIVDAFWGPGFAVVAWFWFVRTGEGHERQWLVPALVSLWALRLAAHILWRSRGQGEDYRYREMREKAGPGFWWKSLFTVHLLQAAILWIVAVPLWHVQRGSGAAWPAWADLAGVAVFSIGLACETVADLQLQLFRSDPSRRGQVLDSGLWRYSRHPNYFGDCVVWWGLFLLAVPVPGFAWTVFGPIVMTFLLLRVSGVALLEQGLSRSKPGYADYIARTNAFLPWFPKRAAAPGGARAKGEHV